MKIETSDVANLPTAFGEFKTQSIREMNEGNVTEHLVVFTWPLPDVPLIRVHSECLTGDVFRSRKCDCGQELAIAMEKIEQEGGMLIYLRQEGRGIGLFNKINAYKLQDGGLDTVEANIALGFDKDARNYEVVGAIFEHFGMKEINLLTNNPKKVDEMSRYVKVLRSSIIVSPNKYNEKYLEVKKRKMGHLL